MQKAAAAKSGEAKTANAAEGAKTDEDEPVVHEAEESTEEDEGKTDAK